jgi:modification methylase
MVLAKDLFRLKSKGVAGFGDVWQMTPDTNPHPAPFPLALPSRILEATTGDLILDPFAGSCTTGVACVHRGKRFIGIEKDPLYWEMGCQRLTEAQRQGDFLRDTAIIPRQEVLFS